MKTKVIKTFVDRFTRELMEAGTVAEYDAERARLLIERGLVEKIVDKPKKKAPEGE